MVRGSDLYTAVMDYVSVMLYSTFHIPHSTWVGDLLVMETNLIHHIIIGFITFSSSFLSFLFFPVNFWLRFILIFHLRPSIGSWFYFWNAKRHRVKGKSVKRVEEVEEVDRPLRLTIAILITVI